MIAKVFSKNLQPPLLEVFRRSRPRSVVHWAPKTSHPPGYSKTHQPAHHRSAQLSNTTGGLNNTERTTGGRSSHSLHSKGTRLRRRPTNLFILGMGPTRRRRRRRLLNSPPNVITSTPYLEIHTLVSHRCKAMATIKLRTRDPRLPLPISLPSSW